MTTWKKPDFEEISLGMEVTAYVNTDDELPSPFEGTEHDQAEDEPVEARLCQTE
jgi:coenzyme PQQ precursor peptide PqqA